MEGGLTASDVALLNNDGGFGGFGGMIWLFAIIALMGGGFNGFGNNGLANAIGYENLATSNEVQRGFDNQNAMANQREILAAVNSGTAQAVAATNQTFHDNLAAMQNLYNETARDISNLALGQANLMSKQQECCCETKQLIQQTNYEGAMRDAATNANITAQAQKILDAIAQNKIDALQSKVNQLELAQAVNGVVRYPMQTTYCSGANPFGGCACAGI